MALEPGTPPQEPSVLDYVKSRLFFWQRSQVELPPSPDEPGPSPAPRAARWSWRSLLAILFAIAGQRVWELHAYGATGNSAVIGSALYLVSIGFLFWATLRNEWGLPPLRESRVQVDGLELRLVPLLGAVFAGVAAFMTLGNNLFTLLNVFLWVLTIALFVWAVWQPAPKGESWFDRLMRWDPNKDFRKPVSRGALLLVALFLVAIFFRFYQLNEVPSEPFSDHAEKILDVFDITQGQAQIFFPRNTGREGLQMYLTVWVAELFGTGLSFLSLKLGTALCGLATLPYIYLLGKELANKRVAFLALFLSGIAYWPNVISRVGLRFPLYPLFVAPVLYYLLRGLRRQERNDFILSGLFLGLGLHGYTPFRIVVIVVLIAIGIYLLHRQSRGNRQQVITWLCILGLTSFMVFLPLASYFVEHPQDFMFRALTRMGTVETTYQAPVGQILVSNLWNALRMFNWNDGSIWVNSIMYRPALDVISGALFLLGMVLLLVRYVRQRNWVDLFLLLSIPLLELPSMLSLAFPVENPALNRTSGALVPVFLVAALALDGLLSALGWRENEPEPEQAPSENRPQVKSSRPGRPVVAWLVLGILLTWSLVQNYDLVFNQYATQFRLGSWNTSEMGKVIKQFDETHDTTDTVWIVPYPYWVDTRLPGVWAGIPNRDFAIWPEFLATTLESSGPKLFILHQEDTSSLEMLQALYPDGALRLVPSAVEGHEFLTYSVP